MAAKIVSCGFYPRQQSSEAVNAGVAALPDHSGRDLQMCARFVEKTVVAADAMLRGL